MTNPPSSRPRGGQPANTNALKHGFYTRRVPGLKTSALEALDTEFPGLEEEIFVLRAYIRRVLEWSGACLDYHEGLLLLRTLCMAFSTLARLTREHRAMTAQPIDTLANLREAHTGVAQTQPPSGSYNDFIDTMLQLFPNTRPEDYFNAVEDRLSPDTFDSHSRFTPAPFPTPVTLCTPQPASPPSTKDQPAPPSYNSFPNSNADQLPVPPELPVPPPELPVPPPLLKSDVSKPFKPDPLTVLTFRLTHNPSPKASAKAWRQLGKVVGPLPNFTPDPDPLPHPQAESKIRHRARHSLRQP